MASRNMWIGIGIVIIVVVVAAGIYVYFTQMTSPNLTPTKFVTLYEGDQVVNGNVQYLFGSSQSSLTSPGPTLNFKVGDVVSITVYNVGTISHDWAIVNAKSDTAQVMFGAQVGSASNPIAPGSSGTDVFKVTQAGNFYYLCQVPGHVDLGMWGNVVVSA